MLILLQMLIEKLLGESCEFRRFQDDSHVFLNWNLDFVKLFSMQNWLELNAMTTICAVVAQMVASFGHSQCAR